MSVSYRDRNTETRQSLSAATGGSLCCHLIQLKQERHPWQKNKTSDAELPVND